MSEHHNGAVHEQPKSLVGRTIAGLLFGGIIAAGYLYIMIWLLL